MNILLDIYCVAVTLEIEPELFRGYGTFPFTGLLHILS